VVCFSRRGSYHAYTASIPKWGIYIIVTIFFKSDSQVVNKGFSGGRIFILKETDLSILLFTMFQPVWMNLLRLR
jgi:hypothetical protein